LKHYEAKHKNLLLERSKAHFICFPSLLQTTLSSAANFKTLALM